MITGLRYAFQSICKKRINKDSLKNIDIIYAFYIDGTPPSPPLLKGEGVGPSKNGVTWEGGTKNVARRGDNPEKDEG